MATCKDCIHYDVCSLEEGEIFIGAKKNGFCGKYKDKSRFVELPCKVGDIVYKISFVNKIVTPLKVEGFICNLASWKVHCTHLVPSWVGNQKEHIYIAFSSFGKRVFLTREEAEKALKEQEGIT